MPDNEQLKHIRSAIASHSDQFLSIVGHPKFKKIFGKLEGEKLQRAPKGYEPDHPMAEWLKYKQFFVWIEWPESKCLKESFVTEVAEVYKAATPLVHFLNEAIG